MTARRMAIALVMTIAVLLSPLAIVDAHRPVVSPYTFHRDIQPIIEKRCGPCHAPGGVSMPLLRFEDARANTWPMRQALMSGRMPPWYAEGDLLKAPEQISTRELNMLMTWAAGGAPEGVATNHDATVTARAWALGKPDVILTMPVPFRFDPATTEATHEVKLSSRALQGRWIRAADLMAEAPSIVRRAEVVIKRPSGEDVVALWQPNDVPPTLEGNAAFLVPSSGLVLRVHYQRQTLDPAVLSDRSSLGIYFASPTPVPVRSLEIAESVPASGDRVIVKRIDRQVRAVALRPVDGPADGEARLTLIDASGARRPLARMQLRGGWARRYVFAKPVLLPAGSRIEVSITTTPPGFWTTLTGDSQTGSQRLRLALDVIG